MNSFFLVDLDISWNEFGLTSIAKIVKELSENRQLQHVNLSWNNLTKITPGNFQEDTRDADFYELRKNWIDKQKIQDLNPTYYHYNQEVD